MLVEEVRGRYASKQVKKLRIACTNRTTYTVRTVIEDTSFGQKYKSPCRIRNILMRCFSKNLNFSESYGTRLKVHFMFFGLCLFLDTHTIG